MGTKIGRLNECVGFLIFLMKRMALSVNEDWESSI